MTDLRLFIDAIGTDGRGIARPEGESVVFVEGALPGETVTASVHHQKKNFREATVKSILDASPNREKPPCPHYGTCGGCNLQHANLATQQTFKQQWLLETLRRLGQWPAAELESAKRMLEFVPGVAQSYRQRVRVHCDGQNIGFRARKSHSIVNVSDCLVAHGDIREQWKSLRQKILGSHTQTHAQEFEITAARSEIVLEPVARRERTQRSGSNEYFEVAHPFVENIVVHKQSFVQPHKDAMNNYAKKIAALVTSFTADTRAASLNFWDLYAGSGPFSMLANLVAAEQNISCTATAVEGVGPATEALKKNTAQWNVKCVASDVGEFCASNAADKPNVVVLDPPRSGATPEVMKLVANACAPNSLVVYVACDAASLARDSRTLFDHGFSLDSLSLYDMFPQTTHYETVAAFRRRTP